MTGVMRATYRLQAEASEVRGRAEALLYEQTVELPPEAVDDPFVRREILARLEGTEPDPRGGHRIRVAFPELATALDPAQVLNVLFGNSSMHPDLELAPPSGRKFSSRAIWRTSTLSTASSPTCSCSSSRRSR